MNVISNFYYRFFGSRIDFSNVSDKKLKKYIGRMDLTNSDEHDYTKEYHGHEATEMDQVNDYPGIYHVKGFNSGGKVIGGKEKMKEGDYMLMRTSNSERIGKFLVLRIDYERFPDDMFDAYIVGMGYKNARKIDHGIVYN